MDERDKPSSFSHSESMLPMSSHGKPLMNPSSKIFSMRMSRYTDSARRQRTISFFIAAPRNDNCNARLKRPPSADDLGSRAGVGKHLQQQRVRGGAVNNAAGRNAAVHRGDGAFHFGLHSAVHRAAFD